MEKKQLSRCLAVGYEAAPEHSHGCVSVVYASLHIHTDGLVHGKGYHIVVILHRV